MDEKCRNCEYYVESDKINAGQCRRYPPVVYGDVSNAGGIGETYPSTAWPEVCATDFCGEFKTGKQPLMQIDLRPKAVQDD